jgi:hypothetical protein
MIAGFAWAMISGVKGEKAGEKAEILGAGK